MEALSAADVSLLCNYRKERLGEIEEQSRALDVKVRDDLIQALIMGTGASKEDIVTGGSRLALLIRGSQKAGFVGEFSKQLEFES
jgi:hypothetical protein